MAAFAVPVGEENDFGVLAGDLVAEVGDGYAFVEGNDGSSEAECFEGGFVVGSFDDDGGVLVVLYEFFEEFGEVIEGFSIVH